MVQVIEVHTLRGAGVDGDPLRLVRHYYSPDGELLAEHDPIQMDQVYGALRAKIEGLLGKKQHRSEEVHGAWNDAVYQALSFLPKEGECD